MVVQVLEDEDVVSQEVKVNLLLLAQRIMEKRRELFSYPTEKVQVINARRNNLVSGFEKLKPSDFDDRFCELCILEKIVRRPLSKKGLRALKPLQLVHTDVRGPIRPTSWDGYNYFFTFIDDYIHFVDVYLMKNKEVFEKFKAYYNYVTNHFERKVLKLRADNGGEYINRVKQLLNSEFQMKDLGSYNLKYLGINITKENDYLVIDKKDYLESVPVKFGMLNYNQVETSLDVNTNFNEDYVVDSTLEQKCRSGIGWLMYAAIGSRPDLVRLFHICQGSSQNL
ncbi:hypothetical protein ILUMI_26757 [Ignelater luminosus]|uniref:Integrase catalytic domain-containing protein n=1 Tax=Ignelater luminosus TaxID=2038154 RepID=A0A8K0C984_IGNLU|nr:hypothetical protein ILUMI_26757 [Ignelater luminosus]